MRRLDMRRAMLMGLVWGGCVWAQVGTSGADFLKMPVGLRNAGMAGAGVAVAEDVEALQVNPAGLGRLQGFEGAYEHQVWWGEVNWDTVAFGMPVWGGSAGVTASYLYTGAVEIYDGWSELSDRMVFSGYQVRLGYGRQVWGNEWMRVWSGGGLGVIGKGLRSEREGGRQWVKPVVDVGAQAVVGHAGLREVFPKGAVVGLAIRNVDALRGERGERWPLEVKAGIGGKVYDAVTVALDGVWTDGGGAGAMVGAEYWIRDLVVLRAGGRFVSSQVGWWGAGVGVRTKVSGVGLEVDYALVPSLELTHKMGLKVGWGR